MILEDVQKKLKSIKTLSKSNWIIGICKIISFIIALVLCIVAIILPYNINNLDSIGNTYVPFPVSQISTNIALSSTSTFFWFVFACLCLSTIIMNIIIAVKSSNDGIVAQNSKEISIKQTFSTNMILAIISVFFINMILNIIIFVKTKDALKALDVPKELEITTI